MKQLLDSLVATVIQLNVRDVIDILLITVVLVQLLRLTRESRASQVLKGFAAIIIGAQVSRLIGLTGMAWLLNYVVGAGAIVMVILFQPELRRALERLGAGKLLSTSALISSQESLSAEDCTEAILHAVQSMAKSRTGALIVLQRDNTLENIAESGTHIDALLSTELLVNLFVPKTPLHDGATIIKGDRIVAAGCLLPLTGSTQLSSELGTRHRAALGMSESTDALVLIVSEETGIISAAEGGSLRRYLDGYSLRSLIAQTYKGREGAIPTLNTLLKRRLRNHEKDS